MKNNLAENLKKLRKDNNLSQEDLADKLGVSRQAISKWEMGDAYPEMDKIMQLSEMYNVSVDNLIHNDVREVKSEEKAKNNVNKYVDSFFKFITDSISMFCSLKFGAKINLIIEQFLIAGVFALLCVIVGGILNGILENAFVGLIGIKFYKILSILNAIYTLVCLFFGIIIIGQVFKIRYLNYYRVVKDSDNEDNKKDDTKKETKKDEKIVAPNEKVVIRDPENSNNTVLKIFVILFKIFFVVPVLFNFCVTLIAVIVASVYSLIICHSGLLFLGIFISSIGSALFCIDIIILLINFLFNRHNNKKLLIWSFIISLLLIGVGIGMALIGIKDITVIEPKYDTKEVTVKMNDNLYFHDSNMNINYIEENRKDIKIEYYETDYCTMSQSEYDNGLRFEYSCDPFKAYNYLLKALNNKQFYTDFYDSTITVKTSKENINKLKQNYDNTFKNIIEEE